MQFGLPAEEVKYLQKNVNRLVVGQFEKFAPVLELCRSVERIAKRNQNWERSDQPYTQEPKHLKKSAVSNEDY